MIPGANLSSLHALKHKYPDLRLMPNSSLAFPASEINFDEKQQRVQLSFSGLLGVDSPLPSYLYASNDIDQAWKILLSVLSERFYQHLLSAWQLFQPMLQLSERQHQYYRFLSVLTGLSQKHHYLMPLFSCFLQKRVNEKNLTRLLRVFFVKEKIAIERPCFYVNYQALSLNAMRLGDNAMLGSRVLQQGRKLRLSIHLDSYVDYVEHQKEAVLLRQVLGEYLGQGYQYELHFQIKIKQLKAKRLLNNSLRLGEPIFLGRSYRNFSMNT